MRRLWRKEGGLPLSLPMTSPASPRSSASESLSPQQAAATLSWSAAARPDAQDDERGPIEESESDEDDGTPAASEMTPELIRASAVAGLGGKQDPCSGVHAPADLDELAGLLLYAHFPHMPT